MDLKKIRELSKALTETQDKPENKIMYGTVISADTDGVIVQLEGADVGIPVNATIEVHENDRVMVQFNDHEASIIGNVSDKSITRTTAEGLVDVFARNGTFSGTLSAPLGNIGGWSLTDSALYRGNSSFGNADGMYFGSNGLSIKDKFMVNSSGVLTAKSATFYGNDNSIEISMSDKISMTDNTRDTTRDLVRITNIRKVPMQEGYHEFRLLLRGDNIKMWDSFSGKTGMISHVAGNLSITSDYNVIINTQEMYVDSRIVLPNNKALRALDTNNEEKNLIYLNTADNVIINGNSSGTTYIVSNTSVSGAVSASGNIVSTGGFLSSNNCTSPSGGVSGGYINANGRCVLVGADSSNYPQVVFVTSKSTSRSTTLRSNNTSGTYTLTLPNSTGTLAVASSDKRLKENIKPSEASGLDLINKIELKQFDWKAEAREGAPHWKIGMIADELEELDENLVFGGGDNEDGTMNVKGIDTTGMIAYLVKAVQELSAEVKALRGEQNVK